MKTSAQFLNAMKEHLGLPSDYAAAPILGVTRSAISKIRTGKDGFGDATALRLAALLDIDPAYVLACCHAERAKQEAEKAAWRRIAEQFARAAGVAGMVVMLHGLSPTSAQASGTYSGGEGATNLRIIGGRKRRPAAPSSERTSPLSDFIRRALGPLCLA